MNTLEQWVLDNVREKTHAGGEASPHTLISREAEVHAGSRVLDDAQVLGKAIVKGKSTLSKFAKAMEFCCVEDSKILEHARVGGYAYFVDSWAEGTSDIRGSCIVRSSVVKDNAIITDRAVVEMCNIGCNARVLGNAKLYNVYFRSEANGDINNTITLEGDVVIEFAAPMELKPGTRLHEGYWFRPPFVIDTPVFPTVEGVGDRVQIGCLNRPLDYWFRKGLPRLMSYGLPVAMYDDFYDAMVMMRDFKNEFGSPDNPKRKK